mgnify:CR=1 FL=1
MLIHDPISGGYRFPKSDVEALTHNSAMQKARFDAQRGWPLGAAPSKDFRNEYERELKKVKGKHNQAFPVTNRHSKKDRSSDGASGYPHRNDDFVPAPKMTPEEKAAAEAERRRKEAITAEKNRIKGIEAAKHNCGLVLDILKCDIESGLLIRFLADKTSHKAPIIEFLNELPNNKVNRLNKDANKETILRAIVSEYNNGNLREALSAANAQGQALRKYLRSYLDNVSEYDRERRNRNNCSKNNMASGLMTPLGIGAAFVAAGVYFFSLVDRDQAPTQPSDQQTQVPAPIAPTDRTLPYSQTYCVTAESGLNVRANPMIRAGNVIASLPFNTAVATGGQRMNVNWQPIVLPGGQRGQQGQWGYVHTDHIRPCGP